MSARRKLMGLLRFIPFYLWEVLHSNVRVAFDILTPKDYFAPAIVAIPLVPMSDLQLLMLTNLTTMTPGTLALDVSEDRRTLYIHAMYAKDPEALITDFTEDFIPRVLDAF